MPPATPQKVIPPVEGLAVETEKCLLHRRSIQETRLVHPTGGPAATTKARCNLFNSTTQQCMEI